MAKFCHELEDLPELCRVIAGEKGIPEQLVEKDYWIMHCLWGLEQLGLQFHMKGGTSLSKGWNLLERFSEDIDIYIFPQEGDDVPTGKNHSKKAHIEKRRKYFDDLTGRITIDGISESVRETSFDDELMRNAGITLKYSSSFANIEGVKSGVLLEAGFDQTTPNEGRLISSWVYDRAVASGIEVTDNRARDVKCYLPEYTFVEKLQTISTKYRKERESGKIAENQLRHYYDVDCLLKTQRVRDFIGTDDYREHKKKRFRAKDEPDLTKNEAFILSDPDVRKKYVEGFARISSLFYGEKPELEKILENLNGWLGKL